MMGDGDEPESNARGAWLEGLRGQEPAARRRARTAWAPTRYRERLFGYPNTDLCRLAPGSVACLFQSGGTIQFWMRSAAERGLRFSYCVTSGNEPDLGLADYLNFVLDDPHTRQVVLFIEGIRRPEAFMHAAGRALAMGKPILAIKTGATAKSQAASQSHTGAIAGDYAAYLAMCERYGIVNCRSLDDMVETALAFEGGRLPKGPRIGFVTTSGGTVDLLYDYAEAEGAAMPDFTDATKAALMPHDAGRHRAEEPARRRHSRRPSRSPPSLRDRGAAIPTSTWWPGPRRMPRKADAWGDVTPLRQLLTQTDKPIVGFGRMIYQISDSHLEAQEAAGFPFLQGLEPTIRALNGAVVPRRAARAACRRRRRRRRRAISRRRRSTPRSRATASRCRKAARSRSAAEAATAAERIGFPVALKIRSRDILHKTEAGGVALDLRNRAAVQRRADALIASARAAQPGRAHRRLPGAGDGVGRRGHRRRAQRPALRADAAGRRRRHPGRARQGRGAAPAAGRARRTCAR